MANNPRWSYSGFLPSLIKTEHPHHRDPCTDPTQHGFEEPIHASFEQSSPRANYLSCKPAKAAFAAVGINEILEASPGGLAQYTEVWIARNVIWLVECILLIVKV